MIYYLLSSTVDSSSKVTTTASLLWIYHNQLYTYLKFVKSFPFCPLCFHNFIHTTRMSDSYIRISSLRYAYRWIPIKICRPHGVIIRSFVGMTWAHTYIRVITPITVSVIAISLLAFSHNRLLYKPISP